MHQNVLSCVKILGTNENYWSSSGVCYGLELFWNRSWQGKWDGAIAHVKSVLCSKQVKTVGATKLQNALDVCNFLQTSMGEAHLAYPTILFL
jgi:hypothetical protein